MYKKKPALTTLTEPRVCNACKELKPISDYTVRTQKRPYPRGTCRTCSSKAALEYRKNNAGYSRRYKKYMLRTLYGMEIEEFDEMIAVQGGVCAICQKLPSEKQPFLAVDHNHKTGKVRSLLCSKCNMALGGVNDDPVILARMIEYLEFHDDEEIDAQ